MITARDINQNCEKQQELFNPTIHKVHITSLVIYSLEGGHTHIHTRMKGPGTHQAHWFKHLILMQVCTV